MKNTEANMEALFDEIVERGRAEGVEDEQAFRDLVEEVVMDNGEDEGWYEEDEGGEMMEQLRGRWEEYREAVGLTASAEEIEQ